jgi:hypothetical protein
MRRAALPLLLTLVLPAAAHADGNVTTTQTGESITIKGDAADNDFDVKHGTDAMGNDVLVIEGKNGTTINGQPKFEIQLDPDPNRFESLSIQNSSGGGDDVTVDLSGLPEGLRLDNLEVSGDPAGTTTIKNVRTTAKGDITVVPRGTIVVESCDAESLDIAGTGGGSVTVKECNIDKRVKVDTAINPIEITIQDSFFGDLKNKSGTPVNVQNRSQFRVLRSTGKKVSYSGNEGDNEVSFEDSSVEQVSLKLGDGADLVWFAGSTIEKVSLDGGPGDADCYDESVNGNVLGSVKTKGFEPCNVNLAFQNGAGTNALDPETWPSEAVAWRTVNPEAGHLDGPFALPGQGASLGLPERDPSMLAPPAHWGVGPECVAGPVQLQHVHDAWEGHGDPDDDGCGHGFLEWGFFLPG